MATITNLDSLRTQLRKGPVHFCFWKKNGELRHAYGTTNLGFVPESDHPKGLRTPDPDKVVTYYDLEKQAWRCCKPALFECYIINNIIQL